MCLHEKLWLGERMKREWMYMRHCLGNPSVDLKKMDLQTSFSSDLLLSDVAVVASKSPETHQLPSAQVWVAALQVWVCVSAYLFFLHFRYRNIWTVRCEAGCAVAGGNVSFSRRDMKLMFVQTSKSLSVLLSVGRWRSFFLHNNLMNWGLRKDSKTRSSKSNKSKGEKCRFFR